MRGREVTGGSTPKATLFELALFRRFVTSSLLPESYGESVGFGVRVNDWDSNFETRLQHLKPSHDAAHDAHHVADQRGPGYSRSDFVLATRRVRAVHGQGDRCAADRSGDGLGCAAGDVVKNCRIGLYNLGSRKCRRCLKPKAIGHDGVNQFGGSTHYTLGIKSWKRSLGNLPRLSWGDTRPGADPIADSNAAYQFIFFGNANFWYPHLVPRSRVFANLVGLNSLSSLSLKTQSLSRENLIPCRIPPCVMDLYPTILF